MRFVEYTNPEIDYFLEICNFTAEERQIFVKKCKGESDIEVSMELSISTRTVSRIIRGIKNKIERVLANGRL